MKHIFIINPAAGKGKEAKRFEQMISDACAVSGTNYSIYYTKERGDATRFVRACIMEKPEGEVYRFYACGGDGTLSEVVCGAVNENAKHLAMPRSGIEVGCIPIGTGNDFVRNFTNPEFFRDVTKQILADATVVDCYSYGESTYGMNMVNIGFDCDVAAKASELKNNSLIPKSLAYIAGVAILLRQNKGRTIRVIREDGTEITREFQLVSAANGGFCGGGFHSAPKSLLSDGLLDISLIRKVTRRQLIALIGAYKNGKHLGTRLGKKVVDYSKAHSVTFEFSEPTNVCIDGEICIMDRLELSVMPNAIAFAIPVGCSIK